MPDTLVSGFYTAADVPLTGVLDRDDNLVTISDPRVCEYTFFDLSTEQLGRTKRYNCWGFTFIPRRYWIGRTDVDNILRDNCDPVPDGSIMVGDVIRYRLGGETTHTGRVWATDGAGHATLIRSKWGPGAEYIHLPLDVPSIYGTELAYFRQRAPLRGDPAETNKIADLWIKDSPGDNGEQHPGAPWWTSPDILVDRPPYDGVPDTRPVFNHVNRVWAVIRNRTNQLVDNVRVRYYWADPAAGLPPSGWHLIPGTPGHPNPTSTFSINANSSVDANYVEWTPSASPAHQCLLAIAYINDNPHDSLNPDPIVYPFEIPWDNNIGQRNVHVEEMGNGESANFSIKVKLPFRVRLGRPTASIIAMLTYSPRLPVLGFPKRMIPLQVSLSLNKGRKRYLEPIKKYPVPRQSPLAQEERCVLERAVAAGVIPRVSYAKKRVHRLDIGVKVPKKALKGSTYYLHIMQRIFDRFVGGYTFAIVVK
ncbi:MAG: hypothetical protein JSV33_10620 [bacterium]|nr:MAG: hypothetical protein JSV33_10620 [bacterium]